MDSPVFRLQLCVELKGRVEAKNSFQPSRGAGNLVGAYYSPRTKADVLTHVCMNLYYLGR